MATPSKNLQSYAERMPILLDQLKEISEGLVAMKHDIDDLKQWRKDPLDLEQTVNRLTATANRSINLSREMVGLITKECSSVQTAFLFGEDEMKGLHKVENIDINTSMYHKAPRLTPKVGYAEATRRLNRLQPTAENNKQITIRQLAGCLGLRPTEAHIIEFWVMAKPLDPNHEAIKTYGMINVLTPDGRVFFFQAKEFIRVFYENYYVGLLLGKIKAISNRKVGKVVKFLD